MKIAVIAASGRLDTKTSKCFSAAIRVESEWSAGRQEVAQAMLEVIERHSFSKQAPIINSSDK
jgi:hypothetical protein